MLNKRCYGRILFLINGKLWLTKRRVKLMEDGFVRVALLCGTRLCGTLLYMWVSLPWNGGTWLCFECANSYMWDTPLNGTPLYVGQLALVPRRFTELLYMGREATKAF